MRSPLQGKRVAYVPYSRDLSAPGDRRRFVRYAAIRDVTFEVAREGERYDVVVLSSLSDVTRWSRVARGSTRIVYELIDSYLETAPLEPRALLRGTAKFLLRQHRHLELSYRGSLRRMFRRADAVVCSTPEQRAKIRIDNANTHPVLDFHGGEVAEHKLSYESHTPFKLFWEGLPGNLLTFENIASVLRDLSRTRPLSLQLVTDPSYPIANGPFPRLSTHRLIDRYLRGVECQLHPWSAEALTRVAMQSDLGIIPMIERPMYWAKPENKLLLLWRLGAPVVTAPTPAYLRVMRAAGLQLTCDGPQTWRAALERMMDDETVRRDAGERGRAWVMREHSEEALAARWDAVFDSIH